MIKAVFFDIDGTLVRFRDRMPTDTTLRTLERLRKKGVMTFVATGRAELLINNVDVSLFDGVISVNGQMARAGDEIIHQRSFDPAEVKCAVDYMLDSGVSCLFEGVDFLVLNSMNSRFDDALSILHLPVPELGDIRTVLGKDIIQLIFFGDERQEKELLELMPGCESTRWSPIFTDIISRGGGKHVGMQKVLDHFGISREECMAFGDGGNDISMIRHAGIGVAMGNAAAAVKSQADHVTASVDEEGVTQALLHYGII